MAHICDICKRFVADTPNGDYLNECHVCGGEFCDDCGSVVDGVCRKCLEKMK